MTKHAVLTGLSRTVIENIWQETPTVKGLTLKLDAASLRHFSFEPGQWVDFHVPGIASIGGYSICSPPSQLQQQGTFDLCIKASRHPCAEWVHKQAIPAAEVSVKVGGDFTLQRDSSTQPSLFVAGGIGITALSSMIAVLVQQQKQANPVGSNRTPLRPFIMYSATEPTEFAVLKQLLHWHHRGAVNLQLHTTKVHGAPMMLQQSVRGDQSSSSLPTVVPGRINKQHLQAVLQQLRADYGHADVLAYVCGPPQMTDEVTTMLVDLGVQPQDVHSERWW